MMTITRPDLVSLGLGGGLPPLGQQAPQRRYFDFPDVQVPQASQQPQQAPRGMFGQGFQPSRGQAIAGVIGDMLSTLGGGRGAFVPYAMQQRQMAQEQEQARQQAAQRALDEQAQWVQRQQWQRDNPEMILHEDNSGNKWRINPMTGERSMVFYDPTQRFDSNTSYNDRGEQVLIRTPRDNGFNPDGTPRTAGAATGRPAIGSRVRSLPPEGGATANPSRNF